MEQNQDKIYSFLELMDYFSVDPNLETRKKVYRMIKTWSGIQNIVLSWNLGKKYKIESNQTTLHKNNICDKNKKKSKNVRKISVNLYIRSQFIQDFKTEVLEKFLNNQTHINKYIESIITFYIENGFYTPQILFNYMESIKTYNLEIDEIFRYIPFNHNNISNISNKIPIPIQRDIELEYYYFMLNYNFPLSNVLTNNDHICVSYSNQNYLPVNRVRILKKNEIFTNQILKRKMKFIDFSTKFHTYYIISDEDSNTCYILFAHGRIWDYDYSANFITNIINHPEYDNDENNLDGIAKKIVNFFKTISSKIDTLSSKYSTIVLAGHSEGSSYAQAVGYYLAKRNKSYVPSTYIITSAGFSWMPSEDMDIYNFINTQYYGRMMMFGYYSEEPKIGNKTPILVDSYIFENYRHLLLQPSKILFIKNDINSNIHKNIEYSLLFEEVLLKILNGNKKENITKNIQIKKNINLIIMNPRDASILHSWKPSYIDSLKKMYLNMKVPRIAENNKYNSN